MNKRRPRSVGLPIVSIEAELMGLSAPFNVKMSSMMSTAATRKAKLEQELKAEMQRLSVKEQELKDVAKLKEDLAKRDLNISTMIKVIEEFKE